VVPDGASDGGGEEMMRGGRGWRNAQVLEARPSSS
jgi:hypothetical protein